MRWVEHDAQNTLPQRRQWCCGNAARQVGPVITHLGGSPPQPARTAKPDRERGGAARRGAVRPCGDVGGCCGLRAHPPPPEAEFAAAGFALDRLGVGHPPLAAQRPPLGGRRGRRGVDVGRLESSSFVLLGGGGRPGQRDVHAGAFPVRACRSALPLHQLAPRAELRGGQLCSSSCGRQGASSQGRSSTPVGEA